MKRLFFVIAIIMLIAPICAAEEKGRGDGPFSEGGFFSETVSSVTDKIGKVTSGEEKVVDKNAKGIDKDILEYDADSVGRSRGALSNDDFRDYRKRVRREQEQKHEKDTDNR